MPSKKPVATNECTSVAGHFDGRAEALKRYMRHRPMQHDQGFHKSHVMPPSGDYWLCIALTAARAIQQTKLRCKCVHFADHFDGSGGALVLYPAHRPME
jgi:hypothetical protein